MSSSDPKSICFVLTSPFVLNAFLLGHLKGLADLFNVTVCVNTDGYAVSDQLDSRIELLHFPIAREVSPFRDASALLWLMRLFFRRNFDAVHSLTPKGGLLAMVAAYLNRVPLRTHTFTGQVWANRTGLARLVLKTMDRVLAACATCLHADSHSQAQFLQEQRVCRAGEVHVLGNGSIAGVDLARFSSKPGRRQRVRTEMGIPENALVFIFLGRLHPDKGVHLLATAFALLRASRPSVWIVFAGPDEGNLTQALLQECGTQARFVGLTDKPEDYLDAADVLCLPSYREGFGTVIIEAAAMGLPAIASRIYGLTDAVLDGRTGLLFSSGDVGGLHAEMMRMLDFSTRYALGVEAQERARTLFSSESITMHWINYYAKHFDTHAARATS